MHSVALTYLHVIQYSFLPYLFSLAICMQLDITFLLTYICMYIVALPFLGFVCQHKTLLFYTQKIVLLDLLSMKINWSLLIHENVVVSWWQSESKMEIHILHLNIFHFAFLWIILMVVYADKRPSKHYTYYQGKGMKIYMVLYIWSTILLC